MEEITILDQEGATYVGLWTGIDGHRHNLCDTRFRLLAAHCHRVVPVAVCVRKPIAELLGLLAGTPVSHVQLHGFNGPNDVARLKQAGLTVIKTLHLADDGTCPEQRWLDAYCRAETDIFLLDRFAGGDQIGSTGQALSAAALRGWTSRLYGRRIWIAGGLTAERIGSLVEDGLAEAADVDTAARQGGIIARPAVRSLVRAVVQEPLRETA